MTPAQLKAHRRRLGLTQAALAKALGVTLSAVEKWEGGQRPISRVVELALEALEAKPP